MQSVVRVDPNEVHEWVSSLLQDQDAGKTEQLSYSPDNTTVEVVTGTDINGLAAAVSQVLTNKGFQPGATGNHEGAPPASSQVRLVSPSGVLTWSKAGIRPAEKV